GPVEVQSQKRKVFVVKIRAGALLLQTGLEVSMRPDPARARVHPLLEDEHDRAELDQLARNKVDGLPRKDPRLSHLRTGIAVQILDPGLSIEVDHRVQGRYRPFVDLNVARARPADGDVARFGQPVGGEDMLPTDEKTES